MQYEGVDRCQHLKANGTQCGSPALRRRRLCFFHRQAQEQSARIAGSQFGQARFVVPVLEDANAVQMGLMQVMQLLGSGQMDHKTAGLMLYALQTASCNLRRTEFEATDVTDVVIDAGDWAGRRLGLRSGGKTKKIRTRRKKWVRRKAMMRKWAKMKMRMKAKR